MSRSQTGTLHHILVQRDRRRSTTMRPEQTPAGKVLFLRQGRGCPCFRQRHSADRLGRGPSPPAALQQSHPKMVSVEQPHQEHTRPFSSSDPAKELGLSLWGNLPATNHDSEQNPVPQSEVSHRSNECGSRACRPVALRLCRSVRSTCDPPGPRSQRPRIPHTVLPGSFPSAHRAARNNAGCRWRFPTSRCHRS